MRLSIVGSGASGLSCAIQAILQAITLKVGLKVVIFEKDEKLGGNSRKASSGINFLKTEIQELNKVKDTFDLFKKDTVNSALGSNKNDKIDKFREKLIETLVKDSEICYNFLRNNGDIDLSELSKCGGHSVARTHRSKAREDGKPSNIGNDIVNGLLKSIEESDKKSSIEFKTSATVTSLIYENKKVVGLKYTQNGKESEFKSDSVVIATGGFGFNEKLLKENSEFIRNFKYFIPTTNGPYSVGDGLNLGASVNGKIIDLSEIQIHPTGFLNPKNPSSKSVFLAPEALRAYGGVLFNLKGERFVNELDTRDFVSQGIFDNCEPIFKNSPVTSFLLMNEFIENSFNKGAVGFYKKFGLIKNYDNLKAIASEYKIPYSKLEASIKEYNSFYDQSKQGKKVKDKFGKDTFYTKFDIDAPLSLALITPSVHYTMGGLLINEDAQVVDKNDKPIDGLYAAGEVTGGVHGKNRLAGNSLLDCIVFGRKAGQKSVEHYAKNKKDEL